jgi:glyoxylase-like metal-dependent hydrolase (beta-lactamase superfamily II)
LFCEEDGVLFAGDTSFPINFENDTMYKDNYPVLSRLTKKNIKVMYKGHGVTMDLTGRKLPIFDLKSKNNKNKYFEIIL